MSIQELLFIKYIYELIHTQKTLESIFAKQLPETIYVVEKPENNFQWYTAEPDTVEKVCDCIKFLAKSSAIYHYIDTNYSNLWDTVKDVLDSIEYPVAHDICRMIRSINLDMSTYHNIYKKLNNKDDILNFETKLRTAYNYFNSKLAKTYDMVLDAKTSSIPSVEDPVNAALIETIDELFPLQEETDKIEKSELP